MRRYKLIVVLLLLTTLTGCIQKYEYSEEQTNAAAEYIAGLMLSYDDYNTLISVEEIVKRQEAEAAEAVTPTPSGSQDTNSNQGDTTANPSSPTGVAKDYTLTEVIGEKGFDIQYESYVIVDSYPEDVTDAYFSITPREGNQLVVLSFLLKNKLNKENNLNLTQADILYQLDVNVGTIYEPPFALLENNLKLIDMSLKAEEEKPVVLIFEVKRDIVMTDINLMVTRDNKSEIIEIK